MAWGGGQIQGVDVDYSTNSPRVGGPQKRSSNRKPANLRLQFFRFADLMQLWQCADLRTIYFAICGFAICGPNFFADLKLPQKHDFYPYIFKLKMLSFKSKDEVGFWDSFELRSLKYSTTPTPPRPCRFLASWLKIVAGPTSPNSSLDKLYTHPLLTYILTPAHLLLYSPQLQHFTISTS